MTELPDFNLGSASSTSFFTIRARSGPSKRFARSESSYIVAPVPPLALDALPAAAPRLKSAEKRPMTKVSPSKACEPSDGSGLALNVGSCRRSDAGLGLVGTVIASDRIGANGKTLRRAAGRKRALSQHGPATNKQLQSASPLVLGRKPAMNSCPGERCNRNDKPIETSRC